MKNSEKILKTISSLIESGILTTKDLKKEISTDFKFKKDKIINQLNLVTRAEFEVLKKIVQNQDKIIKELKKNTKIKNLIAVIGGKNNFASIKIHKNNGFQYVGTIKKAGFKKNKWVDSIYMQKRL